MEENTSLTTYENPTGLDLPCPGNGNENKCITEWINAQQLIPPDRTINVVATGSGTATIGNTYHGGEFHIYNGQQQESNDECKQNEESLARSLRSKMIALYERITLPCVNWIAKERSLEMDEFYCDLQIVSESKRERKKINLEEIFNSHEDQMPTRILVEAQPGYGKTTLATKLAYDWAKGKKYVSHFDLAFFIPLRYLRGKTLIEVLQEICKGVKLCEIIDVIESDQVKTLLILDGFDEIHPDSRLDVLKALFKCQFMNATIFVSCRTGVFPISRDEVKELYPLHPSVNTNFQDVKIFIKGITEASRVKFLLKFAPDCIPEQICNQLKDLPHKSNKMLKCPLFLLQMSHFALNHKMLDTNSTLTDFYKLMINNIVNYNLKRDLQLKAKEIDLFDLNDKTSRVYQKQLENFGAVCVNRLRNKEFCFQANDVIENVYKLGLLIKHKNIDFTETTESYECFHLSILEFCAAYFVWRRYEIVGKLAFLKIDLVKTLASFQFRPTVLPFNQFLWDLLQSKHSELFMFVLGIFLLYGSVFSCYRLITDIFLIVVKNVFS